MILYDVVGPYLRVRRDIGPHIVNILSLLCGLRMFVVTTTAVYDGVGILSYRVVNEIVMRSL